MNRGRVEEIIYKASFSVAVMVFLLAAFEIASYLALRFYPPTTPLSRVERVEDNVAYSPYVLWKIKPHEGADVVVNPDGTRRTLHSHCGPADYTIWMFGGSTVWGEGVPDGGTIPTFLASEYAQHGHPVCVRNFGEDAWVNTQAVIELMLKLKSAQRAPNLVIIYGGINDAQALFESGVPDAHLQMDHIRALLKRRHGRGEGFHYLAQTNTFAILKRIRRRLVGSAKWTPPHVTPASIQAEFGLGTIGNMKVMDALARQYGFEYALFWQPTLLAEHKPLTAREGTELHKFDQQFPGNHTVYAGLYAQARAERDRHFFYIADMFNQTTEPLYKDVWHLNLAGNRLVAERMDDPLHPLRK